LAVDDALQVVQLLMQRARELEAALLLHGQHLAADDAMPLLRWLCRQNLATPIQPPGN